MKNNHLKPITNPHIININPNNRTTTNNNRNFTMNRTEASYQFHLLQMMSEMVKQQKLNNMLLGKLTGQNIQRVESSHDHHAFQKSQSKGKLKYQIKDSLYYQSPFKKQHTAYIQSRINQSGQDNLIGDSKTQNRLNSQQHRENDGEGEHLLNKSSLQHQNQLSTSSLKNIETVLQRLQKRMNRNQLVQKQMLKQLKILNQNSKISGFKGKSLKQNSDFYQDPPKLLVIPGPTQNNDQIPDEKKQGNFQRQKFYSRLSEIQPHTDRRQTKVRINFLQMVKESNLLSQNNNSNSTSSIHIDALQKFVSQWLGIVYRATASISWNMLQGQYLSFNQTKVLFTQNIIFNYIEVIKDMRKIFKQKKVQGVKNYLQLEYRVTQRINKGSIGVLQFLCRQYPQTKIEAPNLALRNSVPKLNQSGKIQYQLVGGSKIKFVKKETDNYADQIMTFLNYLIDVTQENYQFFEKTVTKMFQKLYLPPQLRQQQNACSSPAYRDKIKKYTKYLIGRKIPKNTEKYTQQQIQNGIFFIKSPKLIRVLAKWVQQLTDIIKHPKIHILQWFYPFKTHNGAEYHAEYLIRKGVYDKIMQTRHEVFKKLVEIENQCYKIQGQLTQQDHISAQQLIHLSQQQINVGLFSSNMKNALSQYLFLQLNELINFLIKIPLSIDQKKLGYQGHHFMKTAKQNLNALNLITFRVFDLLRCKCVSGQQQILYLMKYFKSFEKNKQKKNTSQQNQMTQNKKEITLVRFKDRLSTGTRDILVNLRYRNGPVCQIQLSVSSQVDIKQDLLDQYNHFLYQLKRSKNLGPLIENVSIWTSLQQRALYFDQLTLRKFNQAQTKPFLHSQTSCKDPNLINLRPFISPIVCKSCKIFYDIPKTCLLVWKCDSCQATVCGQCLYKGKNDIQKKRTMLGPLADSNLIPYIHEFTDIKKLDKMPQYAFITKLPFLKAQLSFVRHCIPNQKEEWQRQVSQIVIRKQIKKVIIRGFLSELHASSKDKIENFLIYGVDPKIISIVTLKQLKQRSQNDPQIKFVNIMDQPNETINIIHIIEKHKKRNLFKYLQEIFEVALVDKITIISVPNTKIIILVQIYFEDNRLRRKLIKRANLHEIKDMAKKNVSVICLEHKRVSDQFSDQKIHKYIDLNQYQQLCFSVKKLELSYGQINTFKYFKNMVNVSILSIDNNFLQNFEGVQNMKHLKKVSAISNRITTLEHFQSLTEIDILRLDFNKIKSFKGIQNLAKMSQLSMSENSVDKFEDYMLNLTGVRKIYLRNNRIQSFNQIKGLQNLYKISLSKNPIKNLNKLDFLKNLKNLSISQLNFDRVPFEIFEMLDLSVLSLHENKIRVIEGLQSQKNLNYIGMNSNRIQKISGLQTLQKLQIIHLKNNKIKKIEGLSKLFQNLKSLNIQNNPIQDICQLNDNTISFEIKWTMQNFTQNAKRDMLRVMKIDDLIFKQFLL